MRHHGCVSVIHQVTWCLVSLEAFCPALQTRLQTTRQILLNLKSNIFQNWSALNFIQTEIKNVDSCFHVGWLAFRSVGQIFKCDHSNESY